MGPRRFNFADQEPDPQPPSFWVPRLLVTAGIAAVAACAHIYYGWSFRFF